MNFEVLEVRFKGKQDLCSSSSIYIDKIQINNHFFEENDISPIENDNYQKT